MSSLCSDASETRHLCNPSSGHPLASCIQIRRAIRQQPHVHVLGPKDAVKLPVELRTPIVKQMRRFLFGLTFFSHYHTSARSIQIQLPFANCGKFLGVARWKVLMAFRARSATWLILSGLRSVSICLCAFAFLPFPQLVQLTWTESAERKCPSQGDRESSGEELVVWSSARRRLNDRRHSDLIRPPETGDRLCRIASCAGFPLAIVGHHLANGLGAPLLI